MKYGAVFVTVICKLNLIVTIESLSKISVEWIPTSSNAVGEIYKIVIPIKLDVTKEEVICVNVILGVVKSGSKKEGIVTL